MRSVPRSRAACWLPVKHTSVRQVGSPQCRALPKLLSCLWSTVLGALPASYSTARRRTRSPRPRCPPLQRTLRRLLALPANRF
jgi:hypothetical protein